MRLFHNNCEGWPSIATRNCSASIADQELNSLWRKQAVRLRFIHGDSGGGFISHFGECLVGEGGAAKPLKARDGTDAFAPDHIRQSIAHALKNSSREAAEPPPSHHHTKLTQSIQQSASQHRMVFVLFGRNFTRNLQADWR
jgi:hypothetical protein